MNRLDALLFGGLVATAVAREEAAREEASRDRLTRDACTGKFAPERGHEDSLEKGRRLWYGSLNLEPGEYSGNAVIVLAGESVLVWLGNTSRNDNSVTSS